MAPAILHGGRAQRDERRAKGRAATEPRIEGSHDASEKSDGWIKRDPADRLDRQPCLFGKPFELVCVTKAR